LKDISTIILLAAFAPGLIRGAFWHDSPSAAGIVWTFLTLGAIWAVFWVAAKLLGSSIVAIIAIFLVIIVANYYAFKGSKFARRAGSSVVTLDSESHE